AIESVAGIGRHWIRLDHYSATRVQRIASDHFESFFSSYSSSPSCNEAYLCFKSTETRNAWITAIRAALDAEKARLSLSYSVSDATDATTGNANGAAMTVEVSRCRKWSFDARPLDRDLVRSSLQRFSQENELFVSHQRQQNRLNLLSVCPDLQIPYNNQLSSEYVRRRQQTADLLESVENSTLEASPSVQKLLPECACSESKRHFLVTCLSLKTGLRASIEDATGAWEIDNPEPFFVSFFLASTADSGTRLSEDFCWNPNSPLVEAMFSPEVFRRLPWHTADTSTIPFIHHQPVSHQPGGKTMAPPPPVPLNPHGSLTPMPSKLAKCRSALLSLDPAIRANHLFLVFRVDKVLVGGISQAAEKYMKAASGAMDAGNAPTSNDLKSGAVLHKSMQSYSKLLGRYRMPFAWGARWLFSKETQVPLFKMDSSKVSEPSLLQSVRQLARLLTLSKETSSAEAMMGTRKTELVLSLTPAVLETLEKSIKAEVLPIQLHVAVNEVSNEVVSQYLVGLVTSQLEAAPSKQRIGDGGKMEKVGPINLLHVNDFSPEEVVKEVEVFVTRKVRVIAGKNSYGAFDPVDGSSGYNNARSSFLLFGDNKRNSMSSLRSEVSTTSTSSALSNGSTANGTGTDSGSASRFLRFSAVLAKAASLELSSLVSGVTHDGAGAEGVVGAAASAAAAAAVEEAGTLFNQPPLSLVDPYRSFVHTLYIYPQALNMAIKHSFGRARNLCCFMEMRESDAVDAKPLKVFYTRPSLIQPAFDTWFNTTVLHHDSSPTFLDEASHKAKVCLPIVLTRRHHLLFRFYHVRCDLATNSTEKTTSTKKALESSTGFAWLPVLNEDGSLVSGTISLPISQDLPKGYLDATAKSTRRPMSNHQSSSSTMGNDVRFSSTTVGIEPAWLDNKRPLFTLALEPVSTMYSLDAKLVSFFDTCAYKLAVYTVPVATDAVAPVGTRSVRFTTDDKSSIPSRSPFPSVAISRINTTTGKLLSNAIKSLLLVECHALVQFFPALANQILEVLLVSSAMSQLETSTASVTGDAGQWLALCQDMIPGGVCDLAKTAVGTFSLILCIIEDALSVSTTTFSPSASLFSKSTQNFTTRPVLLKNFLEFSLDPSTLCSSASDIYKLPTAGSCAHFLHHAVVRGMIALMVDPSCPSEIAHKFFVNAWFFFKVIIKSLAQHLSSSSRYKFERKEWGRLSVAFKTDLTVLLRLVGNWMVEMCAERDEGASEGGPSDTGSTRSQSSSVPGGGCGVYDTQVVETSNTHSKVAKTLGAELADSTADFLAKLLLLIDRGFVLQRLRDLLTVLEIRHNMSPVEVDNFNCLRYRLLQRFSETQFFVQINLPSLSPHLSDRREELTLSERFCKEHFVVGLSLQQVACVLAGCADAGCAVSTRSLRQPLLLLLAQLAKVTFDPRYATSRRLLSRIYMLYLPLVKIALENINALGPPGLQLRELEKVSSHGVSSLGDATGCDSQYRLKSRTSHKLRKLHGHNHNSGHQQPRQTNKKAPIARPSNMTTLSDGSISSLSCPTTSTSNSSNSSSERRSNASSISSSSSTFIGPDGKVAPEKIAVFTGGSLQYVAPRRRLPNEISTTIAAKTKFGSTATLTEGGSGCVNKDEDEDSEIGRVDCSNHYWYANDGGDDGGVDSNGDYNSDIDKNDDEWPERVLEMAGVLPSEKVDVADSQSRPPPPSIVHDAKIGQRPPQVPQSSAGPPPLPPSSSSSSSKVRFQTEPTQFEYTFRRHIHRHPHVHQLPPQHHLNDKCQRDLYICLLQLLANLAEEPVVALLRSLSETERADFLKLLMFAIQHLKYRGRKCIARFNTISTSSVTQRGTLGSPPKSATLDSEYRVLLEANMATEAGLIVLDVLNLMSNTFRRGLETGKPSNPVFQGILDVYVCLLSTGQSERLLKHTFASLRVFISRFAKVLFSETTEALARICMAGLRTSNLNLLPCTDEEGGQSPTALTPVVGTSAVTLSSHSSRCTFDQASAVHVDILRLEACGLIYHMWRTSFEAFESKGFKRVHLQLIISLSKLVGDIGPEFEASLSLLHSLAEMDIQRGGNGSGIESTYARSISQGALLQAPLRGPTANVFMEGIEDLIKRIRTVLTATEEMRRYGNDLYRKIDLQYSLAKSYASNPVLRRTWLEKLAELHLASKNMAEVAMAKLHIAALMADYLNRRGEFPKGCDAFCKVSANIRLEEGSPLCDPAIIELSYNQEDLLRDVADAATALEAAGLFEALQPVYALVTPVYETRRDYTALARIYHHLGRAYENTARAEASGQRLFASYFRVTFFGKSFESLAGKSYIYRTEAWQNINVFLQNQVRIHEERLGVGHVEKLTENYIDPSRLSPGKAYIQVTFVEPYMPTDITTHRTSFDLHHDVRDFFFETPFIMQPGMSTDACLLSSGPKRTDDLTAQWKRRTILTTEAVFPHLRSRLGIVSSRDIDLSPLDAAIDAIQVKVRELTAHIPCAPQESANVSALHLSTTKNQRGVCVTTGASPVGDIGESWVETTAKGECRVPLLLDMQLQGALLPTVNQGPMAYAHSFLASSRSQLHPPEKISRLKRLFFDFLTACLVLLTRYRSLMLRVHPEKYNAMHDAFDRYRVDLSNLLNEEVVVDEMRLQKLVFLCRRHCRLTPLLPITFQCPLVFPLHSVPA
uniref:Dedicator of cytokinesis protein 9 n=1 Tax=Echinococcus canadensis TaxID=519352 RepID=A0A915EZR7_9CEST